MSLQQKYIGKFRHQVNVSDEFYHLAEEEEQTAVILAQMGQYRQACYFLIQAMEKFIRAKVFSLVNPNLEYFRDRNRTHSLEEAVNFLVEVISSDKVVQAQVFSQLNDHVLGNTKYRQLHNNLRYPTYFSRVKNVSPSLYSLNDSTDFYKPFGDDAAFKHWLTDTIPPISYKTA